MNEQVALTKMEENTATLMRRASDVAGVCKQIVLNTALNIQGRKYVRVEGWQAIATAHGCIASSRDVEKIEGGWRAIGVIKRISDGVELASAEGFVGVDETKTWAVRPEYACRAMAQTRAISRACRSAFAHVVVLMDAGLSTTPAEEVPDGGFVDVQAEPAAPQPKAGSQQPQPPQQQPPPVTPPPRPDSFSVGDITTCEAKLVSYKLAQSKPGATKAWEAAFCTFEDASGNTFEAGTFSKTIRESLDVLVGHLVDLTYKPGKKPGTFEIVSIGPADDVSF